jgi:hypothetical protein
VPLLHDLDVTVKGVNKNGAKQQADLVVNARCNYDYTVQGSAGAFICHKGASVRVNVRVPLKYADSRWGADLINMSVNDSSTLTSLVDAVTPATTLPLPVAARTVTKEEVLRNAQSSVNGYSPGAPQRIVKIIMSPFAGLAIIEVPGQRWFGFTDQHYGGAIGCANWRANTTDYGYTVVLDCPSDTNELPIPFDVTKAEVFSLDGVHAAKVYKKGSERYYKVAKGDEMIVIGEVTGNIRQH